MTVRTERARRLHPDARRAALVDATLPLVLRHGAAVSTRQIAEAAGVAEGTIFRAFPDKESLLRAVTAKAFDPGPALRELAAVDPAPPLRDRLVAGVAIMQRRLAGVFGLLDALGLQGPPPPVGAAGCPVPGHGPSSMNEAFRTAFADLVGADAGLLRVPPMELAHVLRLLVISGTHPRITDGRPLTAEQIVAIVLDGLLNPHHVTEDASC